MNGEKRIALAALALAISLAPAMATGQGDSAGAGAGESGISEDAAAHEQLEDAYQEEQDREERHQAYVGSPEAEAERERSRSAYRNLSAAESADLIEDAHPETLGALDADPARGIDELGIDSFVTDEVVVVDPTAEGEPKALSIGATPLRAVPPGGGPKEPLDLTLERRGDRYETKNALAPLELPASLPGAVSLAGTGVEIALAGAEDSSAVRLGERDLVWPEVMSDTDLMAAPIAQGVELFVQIRSPEAAERYALDVSLPEGATLEPAYEGQGAVVRRAGRALVFILPPIATDAQGSEVAVSMEVEGSSLVLTAPHASKDFAYPILLDPIAENYLFYDQTGNIGLDE